MFIGFECTDRWKRREEKGFQDPMHPLGEDLEEDISPLRDTCDLLRALCQGCDIAEIMQHRVGLRTFGTQM
jgi:hypothetical protein